MYNHVLKAVVFQFHTLSLPPLCTCAAYTMNVADSMPPPGQPGRSAQAVGAMPHARSLSPALALARGSHTAAQASPAPEMMTSMPADATPTTTTTAVPPAPGVPGMDCGIPKVVVEGPVDSKFVCSLCRNLLRMPSQGMCGHRFCKQGIIDMVQ